MRFLGIVRIRDHFYALPEKKRMELRQASVAHWEKCRKSGKLKDLYFMGDFKGVVCVWDFKSSEEASQVTIDDPLLDFWDIHTQPIVEWDIGLKVAMKYFGKYAKKVAKKGQ